MNCQEAAELMPWYLNGTLHAAERTDIEEHLAHCSTCRAELGEAEAAGLLFGGHPSVDLLVDYAYDRTEVPRDLVEAHLASCGTCTDELAMVRESRGELSHEGRPERPARVVPLRRPAQAPPLWRAAAAAAAVFGLIGIGGGLWSWRTFDQQTADLAERQRTAESRVVELEEELRGSELAQLNVPIHDLWPDGSVLRSASGAAAELPVHSGPAATLILNSQLAAEQEVARLEIRDAAGQLLQSLAGIQAGASGTITLSLSLDRLPDREARILLFGANGAEPLETYSFELD